MENIKRSELHNLRSVKLIFTGLIMVFKFGIYSQSSSIKSNIYKIKGNQIVVLNFDSLSIEDRVFKDAKSTTLTVKELKSAEAILMNFIKTYNIDEEKKYDDYKKKNPTSKATKKGFLINFKGKYIQQVVPVINEKNEKEVWINAFYISQFNNEDLIFLDWKHKIVSYFGGGNFFFNLKINLNTRKYYDVYVNDNE